MIIPEGLSIYHNGMGDEKGESRDNTEDSLGSITHVMWWRRLRSKFLSQALDFFYGLTDDLKGGGFSFRIPFLAFTLILVFV